MNAAVSRAICSSGSSASIASSRSRISRRRTRRRRSPFLAELKAYLHANVNADEIDRTGEIPQKNIDDLFAMGAFAIKVPKQYGGLGLSQVNYGRAAMLLGSWDANLTALVSAHQSIGVPQPLLIFGTDEQKAKYLPRVARKEISAVRARRK
jgi:alkylation response protein AidB-like acyl-CoA dehydrogenase